MKIFFSSNVQQKEYVAQKVQQHYPDFQKGSDIYQRFISSALFKDCVVLDAGCGDFGMIGNFKNIPSQIIGVDINNDLLKANEIVSRKIQASLEDIPLSSGSVDIVVSEFALEHLENPNKVFKEIFRILKSGGRFIFITSNVKNPAMFTSKLLPNFTHQLLRQKFLKKKEEAHKTFYKINTKEELLGLSKEVGFREGEIVRAGNPEYLTFCYPLVIPAVYLEKIIDRPKLDFLKMYLVGEFIK